MDGYQIFTDATSDLAPELTAGLPSVEMIPMNVEIGGTEYSYGSPEGITAKEFYRLQRAGNFATTSQINPTIYFKHFEPCLRQGTDILYLCFSSGLSGTYYRYEDGKRVKHTVTPVLGEKAAHNGNVVYSLDFEVTPHQLRHTYITNLIHSSVDPKTVQYLAGHESSKITMDIYAKVKYNRPDELVRTMGNAFSQWDSV